MKNAIALNIKEYKFCVEAELKTSIETDIIRKKG